MAESVQALSAKLSYLFPSVRSEIDMIVSETCDDDELLCLSKLIKKFTSRDIAIGMILVFNYLILNFSRLKSIGVQPHLKYSSDLEKPLLRFLERQIESVQNMTSNNESAALRLVGKYSSTIIVHTLHPTRWIEVTDGYSIEPARLGYCVEMAITNTRLRLPRFVENSLVYAVVAILGHEEIHFANEFIKSAVASSESTKWIFEVIKPVIDKYAVSEGMSRVEVNASLTNYHGYCQNPELLRYHYTQLLPLR